MSDLYSVFVASTRGQADSLRGFMIAALIATVIAFLIVVVFH